MLKEVYDDWNFFYCIPINNDFIKMLKEVFDDGYCKFSSIFPYNKAGDVFIVSIKINTN